MSESSPLTAVELIHDLAVRALRLMESWDDTEAAALVAPIHHVAEAGTEPPAARLLGVPGVRATYDWLHSAYADLHWTVHHLVAEGEWVVARATMSGRQTGPVVLYTPDGEVGQFFPAAGRSFAVPQTHWFRIAGGQVVEHLVDSDHLAQGLQLGWFEAPPGPGS